MALSNIFNEPVREITETVVGVGLVGAFLTGDYYFARFTQDLAGGWKEYPWPAGMIINPGIAFVGIIVLVTIFAGIPGIVHAIGEVACDTLQRYGIHLRPKRRRA